MDIQITKEEKEQENNSEESANVAKIGIECCAMSFYPLNPLAQWLGGTAGSANFTDMV